MFRQGLRLGLVLSIVVIGLAYYARPQFPETANNRTQKVCLGLYVKLIDVMSYVGGVLGFNPINITRSLLGLAAFLDKKHDSVEEFTTTMDGVEVMLFRPVGSRDRLLPGIIHYHGGGWALMDPAAYAPVLRTLVDKSKSVIISVNYRRAPEHLYPIPLEDCLRATRHFLADPEKYGVDRTKIGVKGDSAGGNLAMAAALRLTQDGDDTLPPLKFMSLDYPALQMFDLNLPSYRQFKYGPGFVDQKRMVYYWILYSSGVTDEYDFLFSNICSNNHTTSTTKSSALSKYVDASLIPADIQGEFSNYKPVLTENKDAVAKLEKFATDIFFSPLMATDEQLSKLPPAYIMNAEFDVLRDDGFILAERLRRVGVPVEHKYYPTEEHGFLNLVRLDPIATEEAENFARYLNKSLGIV